MYKKYATEVSTLAVRRSADLDCVDAAIGGLGTSQLEAWIDRQKRAMVAELTAYVARMEVERIQFKRQWPADWWQAFKERWFPKWLKDRFPVRYEVFEIDERRYAICPHLRLDPSRPHFEWLEKQQDQREARRMLKDANRWEEAC